MTNTNKEQEILKEFDEKFVKIRNPHNGNKVPYLCAGSKTIKSFISQALSQQRAEIAEDVKQYFGHIQNDGVTGKSMKISVEEILEDILDIINE